jgi:hypothetical protein
MNQIQFDATIITWFNDSTTTISWTNNSLATVEWISYAGTYQMRMADFVRVTTPSATYRFATTPSVLTIPAVDALPFDALAGLVKIGEATRDIKSTATETSITLVGLDTAILGWVLGQQVKGSLIEMWHGFFDSSNVLITAGGTGGLYKFFTGYINSFTISEQWIEEQRMYVGVITVSASSTQIILQNRTAGRYTNNNAWIFFDPTDTSMNRIAFVNTISYQYGKDAPANS